jgi:hypothetical protein
MGAISRDCFGRFDCPFIEIGDARACFGQRRLGLRECIGLTRAQIDNPGTLRG